MKWQRNKGFTVFVLLSLFLVPGVLGANGVSGVETLVKQSKSLLRSAVSVASQFADNMHGKSDHFFSKAGLYVARGANKLTETYERLGGKFSQGDKSGGLAFSPIRGWYNSLKDLGQPLFQGPDVLNNSFYVTLVSTILAVSGSILIVWRVLRRSHAGGNSILILGQPSSGKTTLFYRLLLGDKALPKTVASQVPNIGAVQLFGDKSQETGYEVNLIDIPGSARVRDRFLNEHFGSSDAVVFAIRCSHLVKSADAKHEAAVLLYDVLKRALHTKKGRRPRILIVFNMEEGFVCQVNTIVSELEKEISVINETHEALRQLDEDADVLLEVGETFSFEDFRIKTQFEECDFGNSEEIPKIVNFLVNKKR